MFLGEHQHSLDAKGRLILPAKFRDQLAKGAYLVKGDRCLFVYTETEFMEVAESVREQARQSTVRREAARSFFSGATEATPDKQGRIAIPSHLREYAHLEPNEPVIVAGVFSRLELWNTTLWSEREIAGDKTLSSGEDDLADFGI